MVFGGENTDDPYPLPLPDLETSVNIKLTKKAKYVRIKGKHFVVRSYKFKSVIVAKAGTSQEVTADLAIGGTAYENFNLPIDPSLVYQRTGSACLTDYEFPPNSLGKKINTSKES